MNVVMWCEKPRNNKKSPKYMPEYVSMVFVDPSDWSTHGEIEYKIKADYSDSKKDQFKIVVDAYSNVLDQIEKNPGCSILINSFEDYKNVKTAVENCERHLDVAGYKVLNREENRRINEGRSATNANARRSRSHKAITMFSCGKWTNPQTKYKEQQKINRPLSLGPSGPVQPKGTGTTQPKFTGTTQPKFTGTTQSKGIRPQCNPPKTELGSITASKEIDPNTLGNRKYKVVGPTVGEKEIDLDSFKSIGEFQKNMGLNRAERRSWQKSGVLNPKILDDLRLGLKKPEEIPELRDFIAKSPKYNVKHQAYTDEISKGLIEITEFKRNMAKEAALAEEDRFYPEGSEELHKFDEYDEEVYVEDGVLDEIPDEIDDTDDLDDIQYLKKMKSKGNRSRSNKRPRGNRNGGHGTWFRTNGTVQMSESVKPAPVTPEQVVTPVVVTPTPEQVVTTPIVKPEPKIPKGATFVMNGIAGKYHRIGCYWASLIAEEDRVYLTREELSESFRPCIKCLGRSYKPGDPLKPLPKAPVDKVEPIEKPIVEVVEPIVEVVTPEVAVTPVVVVVTTPEVKVAPQVTKPVTPAPTVQPSITKPVTPAPTVQPSITKLVTPEVKVTPQITRPVTPAPNVQPAPTKPVTQATKVEAPQIQAIPNENLLAPMGSSGEMTEIQYTPTAGVSVLGKQLVDICGKFGINCTIYGGTASILTAAGGWKFDYCSRPVKLYHQNYKSTYSSKANIEYHLQPGDFYSPIDAVQYILSHDNERITRMLGLTIEGLR